MPRIMKTQPIPRGQSVNATLAMAREEAAVPRTAIHPGGRVQ